MIYMSCLRGAGYGFWRSTDGGVSWTKYTIDLGGSVGTSRQDFYPAVVDPNDANHLLMAGHEMNYLVESTDGGQHWSVAPTASGMQQSGGTACIFFINTGNTATTRTTWLWIGQQTGGTYGTWRTTNSGANWTKVDNNEHPHGASGIYQPDSGGVVYMAGYYSQTGNGVLRSTDYGATWTHVGPSTNETLVVGTAKNVYSMYGWATGGQVNPNFQIAAQPGTGTWAQQSVASFASGPNQVSVVNDGTHSILVGAMGNSGLWRYIEP
jgi:hypothetical protein